MACFPRLFLLRLLALLFICSHLEALDFNKRFTHYAHRAWGSEHGLPQNSVYAIQQTRDGYLWLALEGGLARFDGVRFTVFNKQNTPELKHNFIWTLYEAKDGSLWIGTEGGGLVRLKDGKFSSWTTAQGLPDDFIRGITEDGAGNLWVGTKNGLVLFKNGKFEVFTTKHGLSSNRIRCLFTDKEGTVWVGTRDAGLVRIRDGRFTNFTTADGLPSAAILCISQDESGDLWIGTESGLGRLNKNGISAFTTKDGLSNVIVRSLFRDGDGVLWIGTEGGVDRMKSGKISAFAANKEFNADMLISFHEDREKNLWLGTFGGGLHQLRDAKFKTLTSRDGLSSDWAVSVYENREGEFWIGTYGAGLNRMRADQVSTLSMKDGLLNDYVISFAEDASGAMWIGTYGGLNRWSDGKFLEYTAKSGLGNDAVAVLYVDREGALWIGTDRGVNRLQDGKMTSLTVQDGLLDTSVYFFYEDRSGNLWIGTGAGLNRWQKGKLTGFKAAQGLTNDTVYAVYEDQKGDLWVGTGSGLFRMRNGKFTAYTTKHGLTDDGIYTLLEDDQGYFWISSVKGVFRVRKQELDDIAAGKLQNVNAISYGLADGMKTLECASGTQPAAWKARDGKFWYATGAGVSIIDPQKIPTNIVVPPVHVEEVVADGKILPATTMKEELVLQPGTKNLEFRYTALSYRVPERVKFRYKMEGYDRDWVDAGTRRTAYYTNLSPQEYTFRVIAANDDGVWNEAGAAFGLNLRPYFYQTKWFYALCILAAVATGFAAQRLRVARLKKLVATRTQELSNSNQKLMQAQERITKLLEGKPHAMENMTAWSQTIAKDIADVIGAENICIWIREGEAFRSVGEEETVPPSLENVKNALKDSTNGGIVPVTGSTGYIFGALTISAGRMIWGQTERQLISGLANQLGSALEIKRMQEELASAHQRRVATIQQLHDQGIATVHLCAHCGRCFEHTILNCPADGSLLQSPQILPFKILDRYRLNRLLGQGGTGTVYQAYDEKLKRFVAVKILRKEFADDPFMKGRWEREAQMVARLHHPGIVDLYDTGELANGYAFLVMEFLQGVDLARILKEQGPASPAQVAGILQQVGSALNAAHEAGVIHRDLKPANLFLIPDALSFQIKVVDFGIAKSLREDSTITRTGVLLGSPSYMSPEQVRGQSLDERSDLFSLASVTYELLTGKVAFTAESVPEVLMRVLIEDPSALGDADIQRVISWALQKDANMRPATISKWIEQILPLLQNATSGETGWRLEALITELSVPADQTNRTEQI